jgi:hypothetical protein
MCMRNRRSDLDVRDRVRGVDGREDAKSGYVSWPDPNDQLFGAHRSGYLRSSYLAAVMHLKRKPGYWVSRGKAK